MPTSSRRLRLGLLTAMAFASTGCASKFHIVHHAYETGEATVMIGGEKYGPLAPGDEVDFRLDQGRYDVTVMFHSLPDQKTNWVVWLDRRADLTLLDPPR